jgi:hypothetical protein
MSPCKNTILKWLSNLVANWLKITEISEACQTQLVILVKAIFNIPSELWPIFGLI